jgi:hypothetical protein
MSVAIISVHVETSFISIRSFSIFSVNFLRPSLAVFTGLLDDPDPRLFAAGAFLEDDLDSATGAAVGVMDEAVTSGDDTIGSVVFFVSSIVVYFLELSF